MSTDRPARAYPTHAEAERALDKAAERNEEWEAEDARWEGKDGPAGPASS